MKTLREGRAVLELIANTPMISLYFSDKGLTIYATCEFLNPSGSVKDRFAKSLAV